MSLAYLGRWQVYVVKASGHERWSPDSEYWEALGGILARHRLTFEAACDATRAAFAAAGTAPSMFPKALADVLKGLERTNLPAAAADDTPPCPLCGKSGLISVERIDRRPFAVRVGGSPRTMRSVGATCRCPHGARVRAGHDRLDIPAIDDLDHRTWQPVGGWPVEADDLDASDALAEFQARYGASTRPRKGPRPLFDPKPQPAPAIAVGDDWVPF